MTTTNDLGVDAPYEIIFHMNVPGAKSAEDAFDGAARTVGRYGLSGLHILVVNKRTGEEFIATNGEIVPEAEYMEILEQAIQRDDAEADANP